MILRFVLVALLAVLLMGVVPTTDRNGRLGSSWWRSLSALVAMGIVIPVLPPLIDELAGSNAEAGRYTGVFGSVVW